jgi:AAT family amino acid transporter
MDNSGILAREGGLAHTLTKRQITMIGMGGAIGTGLFMGSGIAIGYAGPAVLISYGIAAMIAIVMVLSLSEMAVAHPAAGSFGVYAEMYISPWAGFVVRYTYWAAQVIAIGSEAVATGVYMGFWFPNIPMWLWSIAAASALVGVNARSVASFGTLEYWLALIKVVAIILFIVFGLSTIFGLTGNAVGSRNLTGLPGGFMPNGWTGVWFGVLMALFSFYGIELVAVTSGEAENPKVAIPAALRTLAVRLILFYLLAIGIMVTLIPWTDVGTAVVTQSPFVRLFSNVGIRQAAGVMNFVVITAALSTMNSSLYLASRMVFSLARGGHAPERLGQLGRKGTPVAATLFSGLCVLATASVAMFTPKAYNYLTGIALFGGILVWIAILVSHLRFRARNPVESLAVKAPFFPYAQIVAIGMLIAILVTMAFDTKFWNVAWLVGVPWIAILTVFYLGFGRSAGAAVRSV